MILGGTLTSIDDQDWSSATNLYSMNDKSTISSGGDSANMYHHNYYHHQPPGLTKPHSMMLRQGSTPAYPDYFLSQPMMHPVLSSSRSLLDNQGGLDPSKLPTEAHKSPDNKSNKSPIKTKKGFRKVKSTNEKTTPIDPAARTLIFNCDRQQSIPEKLELLKGQLDLLIYNQSGSRFLQKLLTKANNEVIEFFLSEIDSSLNKLMMDRYGNYFCQELLLSWSGTQRLEILKKIEPNFIQVCRDKKGTHTIQKMVDLVNLPDEEIFFKNALTGHVNYLAIDQQGTHIIQKVINCFSEENRQFAFDEIKNAFLKISKTSHGLWVIKKLVANTTNPENRESLVEYISENAIELVQDPYGNYAVQEIMEKWGEQNFEPLFDKVKSRVAQLSIQKFSSNVIEKWLQMWDQEKQNDFIKHIANIDKLVNVMRNSYGNYVVQKALLLSQGDAKEALADSIYKNIPEIQDKKIRVKWAQLLYNNILNEPELVEKYDLEEYFDDVLSNRSSKSPNPFDSNPSSLNNSPIDMSMGADIQNPMSDNMLMIGSAHGNYYQPPLMQLHPMQSPMVSHPFYNFDPNTDQDEDYYQPFNQYYGMPHYNNNFQ